MITKPKGTSDIYGKDAKIWKYIEEVVDSVMEKYNYGYIRTPIFESTELFHRGIGDSTDIVTKETYDFKDRGDRNITLRPEGPAGVIRSFIENKMYGNNDLPVKLYYNGTMYRYERPQLGRERELTQFGYEILGTDDPISDAEVISIAVNIYKMLGLKDIKVEINSLGDKQSRDNYREALIKYLEPHIDTLCDDCRERLHKNPLRVLDCKIDGESEVLKKAPTTIDYLNEESKDLFEKLKSYLDILEIEYTVNPKIVRGLDYYNHTVFEIKVDIPGLSNAQTIGGGGRYNGLVKQLGGPDTSCCGFASGIGRVVLALKEQDTELPIKDGIDIFIMHVNEDERKYAIYLQQELRMSGFTVDMEYTGRSLKAQFKQADRLKSKFLLILNSEDLENGVVQVKNTTTKEEEKVEIEYLMYYFDEKMADSDMNLENFGDFSFEHNCNCDDDCDCHHEKGCHCNHHHEHEE